jgi:PPM family protein phosphatase
VVEITGNIIIGASVGDSEAWSFRPGGREQLTAHQQRKPLIGSGRATPVPFAASWPPGAVLVIASDGLFKYSSIERLAMATTSGASPAHLVDLVRLKSGCLQDDVAVVLPR